MNGSLGPAPKREESLALPASLGTAQLFDCATSSIATFAKTSSSWPNVTRRDVDAGILESGDFADENKTGFRVHIERTSPTEATIQMKGAGAYFTDLGVDQALSDFKRSLSSCIAGATH